MSAKTTARRIATIAAATCSVGLVCGAALSAARAEEAAEPAPTPSGAEDLFRRGVDALRAGQLADAAALFRLSHEMSPRPATLCNLGITYERWSGHEADAIEAYRRCAEADDTGRFRERALAKVRALEGGAPSEGLEGAEAPWPSRATVSWERVQKAPGCAYFSGPAGASGEEVLGASADLVVAGDGASLAFEGGATFEGRRLGRLVTVGRRTLRSRGGGRWVVEEVIAGTLEEGVLTATYHYEECEEARRAECPGPCTLSAELRVTLARREP